MDVSDLISVRQCLELFAERGAVMSHYTLTSWRRDARFNFPKPVLVVRGLLFDRNAILAWFEAFKQTARYAKFQKRIAANWSLAETKRIMSKASFMPAPAPMVRKKKKPKSEQPGAEAA